MPTRKNGKDVVHPRLPLGEVGTGQGMKTTRLGTITSDTQLDLVIVTFTIQ